MDGTNYLNWISQLLPVLCSNDLFEFVDGSEPCPDQFLCDSKGKLTNNINQEYVLWNKKDQFVLGWLNATLTDKVLPSVSGFTSAQQVWDSLAKRYASHSPAHEQRLKCQLQTLQQGNKTCTNYLATAKSLADQLAVVGKPESENDLLSYVLSGLNSTYNPFVTSISFALRYSPISFDDFQSELLSYEIMIDNQAHVSSMEQLAFAMVAGKNPREGGQWHNKRNFPLKHSARQ
ncbi:hypothetical protein F2P56_011336, partial [Juglans regia]